MIYYWERGKEQMKKIYILKKRALSSHVALEANSILASWSKMVSNLFSLFYPKCLPGSYLF